MNRYRHTALSRLIFAAVSVAAIGGTRARAQDAWNPFQERDRPAAARPLRAPPSPPSDRPEDADRRQTQPLDGIRREELAPPSTLPASAAPAAIERGELAPIMAPDGSGVPVELWQGLDARTVEALIAPISLPVRSPALAGLWRRVWAAPTLEAGTGGIMPLRLEILYRSGRLDDLARLLANPTAPAAIAMAARVAIATGDMPRGCQLVRDALRSRAQLAQRQRGDVLIAAGYCAAADGNAAAAGLTAELLRSEGIAAPLALSALDALAAGGKPRLSAPAASMTALDYRFLLRFPAHPGTQPLEHAEPALLVALARDPSLPDAARIAAAERATTSGIFDAGDLAAAYRSARPESRDMANPLAARVEAGPRRALLFKAAEAERTPFRQVRLVRALLDDGRRVGLHLPIATMLGPMVTAIRPTQEIGWFSETAIEVLVAAGRFDAARDWIARAPQLDPARGRLEHWLALADIADPALRGGRGAGLAALEVVARQGRITGDALHRLAMVLDALDYQVPIPLWDLASRSPQPATGHLPPTGVLSELQAVSKRREFARTVLLAAQAIGPGNAEQAHMIALGDVIRALKRAGLEADARRLGLEALFGIWPRGSGH